MIVNPDSVLGIVPVCVCSCTVFNVFSGYLFPSSQITTNSKQESPICPTFEQIQRSLTTLSNYMYINQVVF